MCVSMYVCERARETAAYIHTCTFFFALAGRLTDVPRQADTTVAGVTRSKTASLETRRTVGRSAMGGGAKTSEEESAAHATQSR